MGAAEVGTTRSQLAPACRAAADRWRVRSWCCPGPSACSRERRHASGGSSATCTWVPDATAGARRRPWSSSWTRSRTPHRRPTAASCCSATASTCPADDGAAARLEASPSGIPEVFAALRRHAGHRHPTSRWCAATTTPRSPARRCRTALRRCCPRPARWPGRPRPAARCRCIRGGCTSRTCSTPSTGTSTTTSTGCRRCWSSRVVAARSSHSLTRLVRDGRRRADPAGWAA